MIREGYLRIFAIDPIRALEHIRPGHNRASGLCSAGLALSPGSRARAQAHSSSTTIYGTAPLE